MARARLNSILVVLVVTVGSLSAAGHDLCTTSATDIGIRVPSTNHSTHWQTTSTAGFNHQPLILLEPTGIYGLRADGLNGWQKAGVWSTELVAGAVGYGITLLPAAYASMATSNDFSRSPYGWLFFALGTGCGTLISPTAVWLTGHYGFKQNVKWRESALGAGAGLAAAAALVGLDALLYKYRGRSTFGTTALDCLDYGAGIALFSFPPIGAVIGANHR